MSRGPYSRSDRDLLARIRRSANGRAGYKQLIRELGLGGGRERRLLLEQLTRMVGRGELVRVEGEAWAVPEAVRPAKVSVPGSDTAAGGLGRSGRERLVSGRLDLHRDGFGFVRSNASEATSMPEVQMPHWSAACSRNFCCNGCSFSPCAMPSMVRMV